jgi:hypothetical protein
VPLTLAIFAGAAVTQMLSASPSHAEPAPPPAAGGDFIHFAVDGDDLRLPTPKGLCPPTPDQSQKVQSLSGVLEQSHLALGAAMLACDLTALSSRRPLALLAGVSNTPGKLPGSRAAFLEEVSKSLRSGAGQRQMQEAMEAGAAQTDVAGAPMSVSGKPTLVDQDQYAAYVFTNALVTKGSAQVGIVSIEAVTLTRGHMVILVVMALPGSMDDAKELLSALKREIKAFVDANDQLAG